MPDINVTVMSVLLFIIECQAGLSMCSLALAFAKAPIRGLSPYRMVRLRQDLGVFELARS